LLRCEHRVLPQPDLRARAAELQHRIDETPDQADAHAAADELHALLDDVANVEELPRPALGFGRTAFANLVKRSRHKSFELWQRAQPGLPQMMGT
jgi:hypothetical protein